MSIRPFRDIIRKKTKVINVGNIKVGGDNPISVQSMTNTLTTDINATINQIKKILAESNDSNSDKPLTKTTAELEDDTKRLEDEFMEEIEDLNNEDKPKRTIH